MLKIVEYSNVPNKRTYTFISCKVCPLTSIEPKRQTLPEINVHALCMHARLFGKLEYISCTARLGKTHDIMIVILIG
jgi:hypothetical protein